MTEKYRLGGVTNTTVYQESDGTIHVQEFQDCQSILDSNQAKRDHRFDSWSPLGTVREEFQIPMVLVEKWRQECGHPMFSEEHMAYMDRELKKPEYAYVSAAPKMRDPHVIVRGAR